MRRESSSPYISKEIYIKSALQKQTLKKKYHLHDAERVPAHMRDADRGVVKFTHGAWYQPNTGHARRLLCGTQGCFTVILGQQSPIYVTRAEYMRKEPGPGISSAAPKVMLERERERERETERERERERAYRDSFRRTDIIIYIGNYYLQYLNSRRETAYRDRV